MFGQVFGAIGSAVGSSFGGGILSTIGRFVGRAFGDYLEHLNYEPEEYYHFKNIKESFHLSKAVYGQPIALIFGTARVNGKIIWANQIKEVQNNSSSNQYFPNSDHTKAVHNVTECSYYLSFALALCEGEIAGISRIWANDELINLEKYKFRLYLGSEQQLPDPLIEASIGLGRTPAFRSLSYAVFEDLPLEDFGNSIPNFSFEVTRRANIPDIIPNSCVEDLVCSINIIPGSGEFVYDTTIQYKTTHTHFGGIISKKPINSHNYCNIADSIYSLNQLQKPQYDP